MIAVHQEATLRKPLRVLLPQRLDRVGEQGLQGLGVQEPEHLGELFFIERLALAVAIIAVLTEDRRHPEALQHEIA